MKNFLKMIGIGVALILVATTGYAQTLTVGSASGTQEQTITIPVNFTNDTNNVVGLQFDVTFDTGLLIVTTDPTKGSALTNIDVFWGANYGDGFAKVIVSTMDLTPLPSGEIAILTILIVGASGTAQLQLSNVVMSDTDGNSVKPAALNNGTISINTSTIQNAAPPDPLLSVLYSPWGEFINPADTPPIAINPTPAMVVPQMSVNSCSDVNWPIMYIWLPDYGIGIDVSPLASSSCESSILTIELGAVDFTDWAGLVFDVYCGYVTSSGDIYYNAYEVNVE